MIHTVIADDEVLARQKLRVLLTAEPDLEIVGEGANGIETTQLVRETHPELLFLDIRMPGMDGFDILEALSVDASESIPKIIFTTAYDSYAIRAFAINAVDYLLKPFTAERLHAAVERAREYLRLVNQTPVPTRDQAASAKRFISRIVFKSRGRILFLPVSDIRCICAEENYVRLSTEHETHLLRETMGRIEEKLDPETFLRVHRSYMVNLQFLKEVRTEKSGELVVVLADGKKVPMSRTYKARMHDLLQG
ncbi:MAG TPA: LytTR family transcriptional regulator DNA-binding domain-containing protein [Terracidiphilus sp.]|nr:LytTR family transcriptional regulator DNA-binding domain-containing protein [Terracidiphilus sp.]